MNPFIQLMERTSARTPSGIQPRSLHPDDAPAAKRAGFQPYSNQRPLDPKMAGGSAFSRCSPGNIPPVFFTYLEAFREKWDGSRAPSRKTVHFLLQRVYLLQLVK